MTDRSVAPMMAILLELVGSCAYVRGEAPVRRLSDAEATRLPEIAAEIRQRNTAELEARRETTAAADDQRTFEQTVAAIPAADAALNQGEVPRSDGAEELPECHRLVARAAQTEAEERAAGRRSDSSDTVAKRKAAMACLTKHPEGMEGRDDDGARPLHIAAMFGGSHMVDALRKKGADPTAMDNKGNYPADYAEETGYTQLAARLAKDGARTDWRVGRFPPKRAQITNAGSVFVRHWIGEVFRICTTDGKPPRHDQQNVLFGLKVTWGSEGRCTSETLFYAPDQVKDANAISLAMRPCNPDFPTPEESRTEACEASPPIW